MLGEGAVVGSRRWDARTIPGCCFWIHADAYVWNGSNIEVILDQSGLRLDLYQPTVARRIATEPVPTSFFGGRKTFLFPLTKDRWYTRQGTDSLLSQTLPWGQTPYTLFVVCSRSEASDVNGDCGAVTWWRSSGNPNGYLMFDSASNNLETFPGAQFQDTAQCNPINTAYVWCAQYNNTSMYHYRNNVPLLFSDGVGTFGSPTNPLLRVGAADEANPGPNASGNYVGNIAEIIMYSRYLTPQERTVAATQLGGYYNIPIAGSWGPR